MEDKNSTSYFMNEMTQKEFDERFKPPKDSAYNFNMINRVLLKLTETPLECTNPKCRCKSRLKKKRS